ncbi:MAG: hypothetical protein H6713_33215 [Myxococcales bacterium]|nr:hypothetical protein [Myxococcales bacterium]MCB9754822.1 hypothetical protein [Myxococcales bacterium]
MIRSKLQLPFCLLAALALAPLTGCGDSGPSGTDSATTGETSEGPGTEGGSTSTGPDLTTDGTVGESTTTGVTTEPATSSTTNTTAVDPCEEVAMRNPPGEECQLDCECALVTNYDPENGTVEYDDSQDGKCFVVPLIGGLCGECVTADDCNGAGCTIPNPLASTPSFCNDGSLGAGCDVDGPNTCQDPLMCGTVLDAAGILTVSTCGDCAESADCMDAAEPNCAPTIDVANFTGTLQCVADGAIPNDNACVKGEGKACESGVCSIAVVMGVIEVGICGECDADNPCQSGSCTDAWVDIDNLPPDPMNPPPDYMPLHGSVCE